MKLNCFINLLLIILINIYFSRGTEISLKTRPGSLFTIPLEFNNPRFSIETPSWIQYEAGAIKGIAGDKLDTYKFTISEQDGSEIVNVQIGISPRASSSNSGGSMSNANDCFHRKYFDRLLNLHEKIVFGIPGGYYTQENQKSVLHYPSSCHHLHNNRINRKQRKSRASSSSDLRNGFYKAKEKEGEEIFEMGSGEEEFDEEDEDYDDDNFDEELEHNRGTDPFLIQPTPTLDYQPVDTSTMLNPNYLEGEIPETHDEIISKNRIMIDSTPRIDFPSHSSIDLFPTTFSSSTNAGSSTNDEFRELGSGDFDIQPSTPIFSSTPISMIPHENILIEYTTPTLSPEQPIQKKLIEKLLLPAGQVFKFNIANGYFSSPHPISYSLAASERDKGKGIPDWVTLEDGVLIAWPPISEISEYTITLVAQDTVTNGITTNDIFLIVRDRSKSRNFNHDFEIKLIKNLSYPSPDSIYKVIEKIQGYAGGREEGDLVITKIERPSEIISIKWTNESLFAGDGQHLCPQHELKRIYNRLSSGPGSHKINPELLRQLKPSYEGKSIEIHLRPNSLCGNIKSSNITGIKQPLNYPIGNYPPQIKQLDSLQVYSGEFFIKKVPETFCYDPEDGQTPFLNLTLTDGRGEPIRNDSWMQFEGKNQEFYGLPPPSPSGKPMIEEYILSCTDKQGRSVPDAIELTISPTEPIDYSAEFRLHFQSLNFNAPEIRKFMEKLSKALNETISDLIVHSYQTSGKDVQFLWHLRRNPTSEAELTKIRRLMLNDDGSLNNGFKDRFRPDFNLTFGQIIPKGRLLGGSTQIHDHVGHENIDNDAGGVLTEEVPMFADVGRTYLITYIIPAALIGIMIILALLFAFILSRKKKSLPRSSEEARAFIKKGVPVIFQDELEDDRGARSRSPAVLREDHPPLPPEYRRSPIQQYQPPPPMARGMNSGSGMGGGGPRGGVRPGIHYRKPPPYLPP